MMVALTGTPGTGKTETAAALARRGYTVISAKETMTEYFIEQDRERETMVVDEEAWAGQFGRVDGIVEGHLTHLLPADRVVVLRCRPDHLTERLRSRGYSDTKIRENVEAELLDVVLIETLEIHEPEVVLEIDTTGRPVDAVADIIEEFLRGDREAVCGTIDWSSFAGEMV